MTMHMSQYKGLISDLRSEIQELKQAKGRANRGAYFSSIEHF